MLSIGERLVNLHHELAHDIKEELRLVFKKAGFEAIEGYSIHENEEYITVYFESPQTTIMIDYFLHNTDFRSVDDVVISSPSEEGLIEEVCCSWDQVWFLLPEWLNNCSKPKP